MVIIKTTENMAANTNQLKRDIQQLLREEQDLKAEIQDLQRRISQREVGISIDSRTDALNSPEAASPPVSLPKMKKRLRITEKINEVKFTNQKVTTLSDGTQEHTADVTTGFIKFRISFKILSLWKTTSI
ncbi:hypothetical protein C0J52_21469 [Blattella germanica]|nr:hypothetical protein C0J52_21469 [Blattella germanica]